MTKSIALLLAAFAVSTPLPAEPSTPPCQGCVSDESAAQPSPPIDRPGYLATVEGRTLTRDTADEKRLASSNASITPEKADVVLSLNSGWKSDFRAPPGAGESAGTIPARFTTAGVAGLQGPSIKDTQVTAEAKRHSGEWLEMLPEWHTGWALVIGVLVVALRRVPIRFRSNGL